MKFSHFLFSPYLSWIFICSDGAVFRCLFLCCGSSSDNLCLVVTLNLIPVDQLCAISELWSLHRIILKCAKLPEVKEDLVKKLFGWREMGSVWFSISSVPAAKAIRFFLLERVATTDWQLSELEICCFLTSDSLAIKNNVFWVIKVPIFSAQLRSNSFFFKLGFKRNS